jgi:hypothetical protein
VPERSWELGLQTMTQPTDHSVRIHVHDPTGRPISGTLVQAVTFNSRATAALATTGGDGTAAFRVLADAKVYNVLALKPGAGMDYFENYQSWPPGELMPLPPEIRLVLDGARDVSVRPVDSADQPVRNVPLVP